MANSEEDSVSLLERCNSASQLGGAISTRLLSLQKGSTQLPHAFQDLQIDLQSLCKCLRSLSLILSNDVKPDESAQSSLRDIFRKVIDDFKKLEELLQRYIKEEEKGVVAATLQKTWRLMFADTEVPQMRAALQRNTNSLMSILQEILLQVVGSSSSSSSAQIFSESQLLSEILARNDQNHVPEDADSILLPTTAELTHRPLSGQGESLSHPEATAVSPTVPENTSVSTTTDIDLNKIGGSSALHQDEPNSRVWGEEPPPAYIVEDEREALLRLEGETPSVERMKVDTSKLQRRVPKGPAQPSSEALKQELIIAVEGKKHAEVEKLLESGTSPDTGPGKVALREAVLRNDVESLRLLLEFGAEADAKDQSKSTSLFTAMEFRHEECTKLLVEYGADPNLCAPQYNPLASAVLQRRTYWVRLCLVYGADPNMKLGDGNTPMALACTTDNLDVLELLVKYGGDVRGVARKHSLLHIARDHRRTDALKFLLDRGADPNTKEPDHILWHASEVPACLKTLLAYGSDPKSCTGILENAAAAGKLESVEALVKAGVDVNEKKSRHSTPLTIAIQDNKKDIFEYLLANGADPNLLGGQYPLEVAARRPQYIKPLIAAGADPRSITGLMERAAAERNIESVRIFLEAGVDLNEKHEETRTALVTSIHVNHDDILDLLLEKGADPNLEGPECPIFAAVNKPKLLKKLVAAGATLTSPPGIVERAADCGNMETLRWVLDQGADPNDKFSNTNTAVTIAIVHNRKEVLEYLLDHGADPNLKGLDVPIILALRRIECFKVLLKAGVDPRLHKGIMEQAVVANKLEIVKLLVEAGVDVNEKQHKIFTPLTTALRDNRKDIVKYLLDHGADCNIIGEHVPLVMAVRRSDIDTVGLLLSKGANVNLAHEKWTALMQAVDSRKPEIARILLENGADLNAKDVCGKTPMDLATSKGSDEMKALLAQF